MAGEFTLLSDRQAEWMCRVLKQMTELTAFYGCKNTHPDDEDYEHIVSVFGGYAKKSRNNVFVIRSSVTFMTYLDELEKGAVELCPRLNQEEMHKVEQMVDGLFNLLLRESGFENPQLQIREVQKNVFAQSERLGKHMLVQELSEIFSEYFSFVLEKKKCREETADEMRKGKSRY